MKKEPALPTSGAEKRVLSKDPLEARDPVLRFSLAGRLDHLAVFQERPALLEVVAAAVAEEAVVPDSDEARGEHVSKEAMTEVCGGEA